MMNVRGWRVILFVFAGLLLLAAVVSLVLSGDTGSVEPEHVEPGHVEPMYIITVTVSPSIEAGSVAEFKDDGEVTLIATSSSGYVFDYWGGDVSGAEDVILVALDSDKHVIANFRVAPVPAPVYVLTTGVVPYGYGLGSVSPSEGEYESGDQVLIAAVPGSGGYFACWGGDASGTDALISVTMDSDKRVVAYFSDGPVPRFAAPGTGAVVGRVLFPDHAAAYRAAVYVFRVGETSSFATDLVDTNGYYMFDDLPVGDYELYKASCAGFWGFTGDPSVTVPVRERETTFVLDLFVLRNIVVALDNPKEATKPGSSLTSRDVIGGHNPRFTWVSVPSAAYYVVGVWSTYSPTLDADSELSDSGAYDESCRVSVSEIVWPVNLSSLSYEHFRVDVNAYMVDDTLLASGYELFTIDDPPEGWVYKWSAN